MRWLVLLAVGAALAAGCGDDDEEGPAAPEPISAETAALAKKCGFGTAQPDATAGDLVPEGLLPDDAAVIRSDGGRAVILLRGALNDAYRTLLSNAQSKNLEIEFQEVETFDAELEVKDDGGVSRFALTTAQGCPDVTRAVVTKQQG